MALFSWFELLSVTDLGCVLTPLASPSNFSGRLPAMVIHSKVLGTDTMGFVGPDYCGWEVGFMFGAYSAIPNRLP